MDELHQRITRARDAFPDQWERDRIDTMLEGVPARQQQLRRRKQVTVAAVALAACALLGLSALWLHDQRAPATDHIATTGATALPKPVQLADGSKVIPATRESDVSVTRVTDRAVLVDLKAGQARFEVTPNPARLFRVRVGDATVEVLGTVFTVRRRDGEMHVAVERGRVRVISATQGSRELGAGQATTVAVAARDVPALEQANTSADDKDEGDDEPTYVFEP